MKWTRRLGAAVVICGMTATVQAGLFDFGGSKSSGCAEDCRPFCCKPTIVRPCCTNVYTFQRKCSNIKPSCCNTCCAPTTCCAPAESCTPATCCVPAECSNEPGSCCPAPDCGKSPGCVPSDCPQKGCCNSREDCCTIARLIYQSMTACYATDRKAAIHKLGDHFDCCCHPEIMNAFIYALNDSDERVRAKAADEIGDQIRRNRCRCGSPTISALTCALADCDRSVRRQAEEALLWCGYKIVDGCRQGAAGQTCAPRNNAAGNVWGSCNNSAADTATAPAELVPPDLSPTEVEVPSPEPLPEAAKSAPAEAATGDTTSVYDITPQTDVDRFLPTVDAASAPNSLADQPARAPSRFGIEKIRTGITELLNKVR